MEAGTLFHHHHPIWFTPIQPLTYKYHHHYHHLHRSSPTLPRFIVVKSSISNSLQSEGYKGPKPKRNLIADFVSNNDDFTRSLPIYVGGFSLLAILFNRAVSGIAPVADASSSQSRADLLALGLAVTNILTGLVWLSIRPKSISKVDPEGVECSWISLNLPDSAVSEFWQSLSAVTCCRSLVIIYADNCICQIGMAAEQSVGGEAEIVDATKLIQGTLYNSTIKSGAQSYLANLSLYPGKSELPFLPANTQAWISLIGDKLDVTLTNSLTRNALMT
ncbi:Protein COFACTOR ASSEMBLY OF COMPLEX C SUBUNIT B CCB4 chloroplastic [Bienertia sinuspersici]